MRASSSCTTPAKTEAPKSATLSTGSSSAAGLSKVYLLRWDLGALKSLFRGKTCLPWPSGCATAHPVKLDAHHPAGGFASSEDRRDRRLFAFCGGIDMTGDRWDTRAHPMTNRAAAQPDGTPYGPGTTRPPRCKARSPRRWASCRRERWKSPAATITAARKHDCWPDELPSSSPTCEVGIARTDPGWTERTLTEIEALYLDQIAAPKR